MIEFLWGFLISAFTVVAFVLPYRKLRPLFPVKVNCWFCNHDNQVPYGNRNCWDCPNCDQYNGFTSDGDYNKEVPAQYTEDINHPVTCHQTEFLTRGQYLCHRCQRNQLLKVKQLATFEPLNEATYDDEIAFYKRHLESVYALCLSCEVTMKRELQRLDDTLGRQQDGLDQKIGAVGDNSSSLVETARPSINPVKTLQLMTTSVTMVTPVCAMLLLSASLYRCKPQAFETFVWAQHVQQVEEHTVCVCALLLCMLSKLLLGKNRLHVWDAVHILLWLAALLACLFRVGAGSRWSLPGPQLSVAAATVLLLAELWVALKQREASDVTSLIIKRLSLEGNVNSGHSDAASEAMSSVSTSHRRQRNASPGHRDRAAAVPSHSAEEPVANGDAVGSPGQLGGGREEGALDILRKDFGAVFLAPGSSDSGCSTGRSSPAVYNNAFGPTGEIGLGAGTPFPRPLISPAKLSVLSFSSSSVCGTSSVAGGRQSAAPSLFSSAWEQKQTEDGDHFNLFLSHKSRPRSMFSVQTAEHVAGKSDRNYPQPGNLPTRPGLLSPWTLPTAAPHRPSLSEANLFMGQSKASHTHTPTATSCIHTPTAASRTHTPTAASRTHTPTPGSWWRDGAVGGVGDKDRRNESQWKDTASDFFIHNKGRHLHNNTSTKWWRDSGSDVITTRDRTPHNDSGISVQPWGGVVSTECDSTTPPEFRIAPRTSATPELSKLFISSSAKRRRKKKKIGLMSKLKERRGEGFEVSDEEELDEFPVSSSSVSEGRVKTKMDWPWLQWLVGVVVVISMATNLFLAWTVWSSV